MSKIKMSQLESVIGRINRITDSPVSTYVACTAQAGNYHLSEQYGGYSLHRITSVSGGIRDVLSCGHVSKRELLSLMLAYIEGLNDGAGIGYGEGRS